MRNCSASIDDRKDFLDAALTGKGGLGPLTFTKIEALGDDKRLKIDITMFSFSHPANAGERQFNAYVSELLASIRETWRCDSSVKRRFGKPGSISPVDFRSELRAVPTKS